LPFTSLKTEEVVQRIEDYGKGRYTLLSDYNRADKNLSLRHHECGGIYEVSLNHFMEGRRCPCEHLTRKAKEFAKEFKVASEGEYEQLSPYVRVHDKIKVKHLSCGTIYTVEPNAWNRGTRCPKCFGKNRKTTKQFSEEVEGLSKGRYELLEGQKYKNNKTKLKFRHIGGCGAVYEATPKDFLRGNRCPHCKSSKGERLVRHTLKDIGVAFEEEKCYEDLKNNGKYLPYDFYIPTSNLLIEYDGMQHFKPTGYFGGEEKLESQKRRDKLKNEYATKNNIRLLRIPYYYSEEDVIDTIKLSL